MKETGNKINKERRKFLRILLLGGGILSAGLVIKFFNPLFNRLIGSKKTEPKTEADLGVKQSESEIETDSEKWQVIKKEGQLIFIDKESQEEVLILDQ
jgi:hypothetical protein